MAKKIFRVVGTELTRTTDREYTHAVVIVHEGEVKNTIGFCGRRDLAENLARRESAQYAKHDRVLEVREVERIK